MPRELLSTMKSRSGPKRHWTSRIRFQLLGGLLVCVWLPSFLRWRDLTPGLSVASINNALIGASVAIIVGYFVMRRFALFPGVQKGASLFLAYSLPFMLVISAFFVFRLDYSRYVFATSYGLILVWSALLQMLTAGSSQQQLMVIPGGNAASLMQLEGVHWVVLETPPLSTNGIAAIAADLRHDHPPAWERFLADCALAGIPVYHTKQLAESITGKVEIEHLSENTFGSILPNMLYLKVKQAADFVLALLALPFFAVLLLLVAPLIVVSSGWPIFFFQSRVGYGGRIFKVCKFRTMVPAAPAAGRDASITKPRDSRITRVGHFLRKYRIDELPQIYNILRGEMSWIGPRPEALTLSRWYEADLAFYRYRHVVMPGITGWAQVNQGHVANPDEVLEKLHYDFFYIKNISPWLDLVIFLRTIRTVATGHGSK